MSVENRSNEHLINLGFILALVVCIVLSLALANMAYRAESYKHKYVTCKTKLLESERN